MHDPTSWFKCKLKPPKNKRKDNVDEQLEDIKYVYWKGKEPKREGQLHIGNQDFDNAPIVIPQQELDAHCLLCPWKKEVNDALHAESDYCLVRHGHSLVLNNTILLMCKCSEVRSVRMDGSTRNSHWHCVEYWHPFRLCPLLRLHLHTQHYYSHQKVSNL